MNQKRQTAQLVTVQQLISGEYVEGEGWDPSIVQIGKRQIGRINIIATVVSVPQDQARQGEIYSFNCTIDDGTGTIELRSFDPIYIADELQLGGIVLVVGRPKVFREQLYIVPEIVKVLQNKSWIEYRKKELSFYPEEQKVQEEPQTEQNVTILDVIDNLDTGDGVMIEEIKNKVDESDITERITQLLLTGEIFEVRPGRVKVLK